MQPRQIPWDLPADSELSSAQRSRVARSWFSRAASEHLAVGAFAMLTQSVAEHGCEPVVLSLLSRAVNDEVRHAELCGRMGAWLLQEPYREKHYKGLPTLPRDASLESRHQSVLHVVEMCCLNETMTGLYFTSMLETTTHPTARALIESLLQDEVDHGRVGWAHLAMSVRDRAVGTALSQALPAMLERSFGPVFKAEREAGAADDPMLERVGYLGPHRSAEVYRAGLRDVVLKGFREVGIETDAAERWAELRGVLS